MYAIISFTSLFLLLASVQVSWARVITLGDSFASGTGIHASTNAYDHGQCWREQKTTPGARYAHLVGQESTMYACFGAEISDVTDKQLSQATEDFPLDAEDDWNGSTFYLSVGGNDVRSARGEIWGQVIARCAYSACQSDELNQVSNFDDIERQLEELYSKLANEASLATIRVMGYPALMMPKGACFIGLGDPAWVDTNIGHLNRMAQKAVESVKASYPGVDIEFVDPGPYFTSGACGWFWNKQVRHLAIDLDHIGLSKSMLHPNQRGYDLFYQAFLDSIHTSGTPEKVFSGPFL